MGIGLKMARSGLQDRMARAEDGEVEALFELGIAYATGAPDVEIDFVAAHKWFNLAALNGSVRGQECRADLAEEMSAREIAEAQKQARAWLAVTRGRLAA